MNPSTEPDHRQTVDSPPQADLTGAVIAGRYKLLQFLGEGGMGAVWRAEQTGPVYRQVALKLIKPGMDSAQINARFEAERQALALMDHPNIAGILDGGLTEDQRPFFVMELVRGVPITQYCDDAKLDVRQRLELFIPVCQAVQHAHQKGIIHRDLKPSNILVALADGKPIPKIIDFGVAKAIHQKLTDKTMVTEFGAMIGTLEYMSPEQADLKALDIDTRSDIYSLGVILYQLLTGTRPFEPKMLREAGIAEMLRIVKEVEPPKPSTRLSSETVTSSGVAERRRTDPVKLVRLLRGDLDWIVMKALEKERTRRYETASGFARDIQRYLADEPVEAGPPSPVYKLRKFVRRNRAGVLAFALLLLTLAAGIAGTSSALVRALRAEKLASDRLTDVTAEKEHANEALARALTAEKLASDRLTEVTAEKENVNSQREKAVTAQRAAKSAEADTRAFAQFLVDDVLAVARPVGEAAGQGIRVTVKEALDTAVPKLAQRFRGRPRAEAQARHAIGVTYRMLGDLPAAEQQLRKALKLREDALGLEADDTLNTRNSLAVVLQKRGRISEALPLLEENHRHVWAKLGPRNRDALMSLNNLATAYYQDGQVKKALELLEECKSRFENVYGPKSHELFGIVINLAAAYSAVDRDKDAVALLEPALPTMQQGIGPDNPTTLMCMSSLAAGYQNVRRIDDALALYEKCWHKMESVLGPDHLDTLATMSRFAMAMTSAGRFADALDLQSKAYERLRATVGEGHPGTLHSMAELALAKMNLGKTSDAVKMYEEALKLLKINEGPDHPDTLVTMSGLATAYQANAEYDKAQATLSEALPVTKKRFGAESRSADAVLLLIARNHLYLKEFDKAESILRERLTGNEAKESEDWNRSFKKLLLGAALVGQKKFADAEPFLLAGCEGMRRHEGKNIIDQRIPQIKAFEYLIKLYEELGNSGEAAKWKSELESLQEKQPGLAPSNPPAGKPAH